MNTKLLVGLAVIALGLVAGWYFLQGGKIMSPTQQVDTTTPTEFVTPTPLNSETTPVVTVGGSGVAGGDKGGVMEKVTVTYSDSGYSPSTITVNAGTTVSFVNQSSSGMWTASDLHPTHQLLPGFDQLKSSATGTTYEYTFTKVGTWTYHNHAKPNHKGTVVVTQ